MHQSDNCAYNNNIDKTCLSKWKAAYIQLVWYVVTFIQEFSIEKDTFLLSLCLPAKEECNEPFVNIVND